MDWYQGPTLIELLESLPVYDDSHDAPLRFPVQLVARHNGHEANDFRGYMSSSFPISPPPRPCVRGK